MGRRDIALIPVQEPDIVKTLRKPSVSPCANTARVKAFVINLKLVPYWGA